MIKIKPVSNRYKMTFSSGIKGERGFTVTVNSLEEVHIAIDHYYFRTHDKSRCPMGCCKEEANAERQPQCELYTKENL